MALNDSGTKVPTVGVVVVGDHDLKIPFGTHDGYGMHIIINSCK